ncbi:MAG: glutamate 5-kinase [Bacteroidota bacterium]|nr:MAG: glutamate 5-kinase [Bacteroidota bacterium]
MNRNEFSNIKSLVVKVGTSTLSYKNGRLNFLRMEKLAQVLSAISSRGIKVTLVTSGAIGVGAGRLFLTEKPKELAKKQALAAIGQAQLIKIYQKFFDHYNQLVAQVLLTKDVMTIVNRHHNAQNTLLKLLDMGIIPIINENDTIATDEIEFGDNDTLSAMVATLIQADLLILLSDIDGLYSADPKKDSTARIIRSVPEITSSIEILAEGSGSSFGTGGMVTKIAAAKITSKAGIDMVLAQGDEPSLMFDILEGKEVGTHFMANKSVGASQVRI